MQPRRLPLHRLWQSDQAHPHEVLAKREHYCIDGSLNRWLPYKNNLGGAKDANETERRMVYETNFTQSAKQSDFDRNSHPRDDSLVLSPSKSNRFFVASIIFLGGSSKSQETSLLAVN